MKKFPELPGSPEEGQSGIGKYFAKKKEAH